MSVGPRDARRESRGGWSGAADGPRSGARASRIVAAAPPDRAPPGTPATRSGSAGRSRRPFRNPAPRGMLLNSTRMAAAGGSTRSTGCGDRLRAGSGGPSSPVRSDVGTGGCGRGRGCRRSPSGVGTRRAAPPGSRSPGRRVRPVLLSMRRATPTRRPWGSARGPRPRLRRRGRSPGPVMWIPADPSDPRRRPPMPTIRRRPMPGQRLRPVPSGHPGRRTDRRRLGQTRCGWLGLRCHLRQAHRAQFSHRERWMRAQLGLRRPTQRSPTRRSPTRRSPTRRSPSLRSPNRRPPSPRPLIRSQPRPMAHRSNVLGPVRQPPNQSTSLHRRAHRSLRPRIARPSILALSSRRPLIRK